MLQHSRPPSAANRFRPGLTRLEDRDVPATFTVTNALNSGLGSLADAVSQANNTAGADLITFDRGLINQTISVTSNADTTITDAVTVRAGSVTGIRIDGGNAFRPFTVNASNVTIEGLTLTNGLGLFGGGIDFGSSALVGDSVIDCAIINNTATGVGGGAHTLTPVAFENCTIANNTAGQGGGLALAAGTVLVNCTVTDNTSVQGFGGGITSDGVQLVNTIVADNTARGIGLDIAGIVTRAPGSIIKNSDGWTILDRTDIVNADPMLDQSVQTGGVKDRGGLSPTIALLPGSGAIDQGKPARYSQLELNQVHVAPSGVTGAVGTFTLTFNGSTTTSTTPPLLLDASAATVAAALNALPSVSGPGGVALVGLTGSGYIITFAGGLADTDLPALTAGATFGTADVTHITDGGQAVTLTLPNDQRGPGYSRNVNSIPDVGAFEFGATPPAPPSTPSLPVTVTAVGVVSPITSSSFGFVSVVPIVVFVHADGNAFAHGPDGKEYLVGTDVRSFSFADTRDRGLVMLATTLDNNLMEYEGGSWHFVVAGVVSATVTTYRGYAVYFATFIDGPVISVGALGTNTYPNVVGSFDVVYADDGTSYEGGIGAGGSVLVVGPGVSINGGSDFGHVDLELIPEGLLIPQGLYVDLVDTFGHVTIENVATGASVQIV